MDGDVTCGDARGAAPCFTGDVGDMPAAARRVAVRLKRGEIVMNSGGNGLWEALHTHRGDVERSLCNDFLSLHVDESNGVAWAVIPDCDGEKSLLKRGTLRRDEVGILVALAEMLVECRNQGLTGADDAFCTHDELFHRWRGIVPTREADTRGEKVSRAFDNAVERAQALQWVVRHDGSRFQITMVVGALLDGGFLKNTATSLYESARQR